MDTPYFLHNNNLLTGWHIWFINWSNMSRAQWGKTKKCSKCKNLQSARYSLNNNSIFPLRQLAMTFSIHVRGRFEQKVGKHTIPQVQFQLFHIRPKQNICLFKLSGQNKVGSVGRKIFFLYSFFSHWGSYRRFGLELELLGVKYTHFCSNPSQIPL